jgi:hypothetical protein
MTKSVSLLAVTLGTLALSGCGSGGVANGCNAAAGGGGIGSGGMAPAAAGAAAPAACQNQGGTGGAVYGSWTAQGVTNGVQVTHVLTIDTNQVTDALTCTFQSGALNSTVSAPATITDTDISITAAKSGEDARDAAGEECKASLGVADWKYSVSTDKNSLTLTTGNGQINLTRQQQQ